MCVQKQVELFCSLQKLTVQVLRVFLIPNSFCKIKWAQNHCLLFLRWNHRLRHLSWLNWLFIYFFYYFLTGCLNLFLKTRTKAFAECLLTGSGNWQHKIELQLSNPVVVCQRQWNCITIFSLLLSEWHKDILTNIWPFHFRCNMWSCMT